MVVECLVHMAQSTWNGGGMHGPYGTVHMEWWWNAWSIWHSPHGMVMECMVHMAQSIWNGGGIHMEYMVIIELENGWSLSQLSFHMDSMEWLMESMESICIPYGI